MRIFNPARILIRTVMTVALICFQQAALSAAAPPVRQVLILNSYHPGMSFSDQEERGIRSTLPDSVEVFVEYLDAKRISGPRYLALISRIQALKYADKRFDMIFSLDDDALRFLMQYHPRLFPQTPVVF